MPSGLPAGISRHDIEVVLSAYNRVTSYRQIADLGSTWIAEVAIDGHSPVDVIVDNGINPIYIQLLISIPPEAAATAIEATMPFALVGVAYVGESLYLRLTLFADHSTMAALKNSLHVITIAYQAMVDSWNGGAGGASAMQTAPPSGATLNAGTRSLRSTASRPGATNTTAAAPIPPALNHQPPAAHTPVPQTPTPPPPPPAPAEIAPPAPLHPLRSPASSLAKGANILLSDGQRPVDDLVVEVGWTVVADHRGEPELDASGILTDNSGRVLSDDHFVFFNNSASPGRELILEGAPRPLGAGAYRSVFSLNLSQISPEVARIVFAVSIYEGQAKGHSYRQVSEGFLAASRPDGDSELTRFHMTSPGSTETAMVFGEIYRHPSGWKFRAIGQGYSNGLEGIATDYGVIVG